MQAYADLKGVFARYIELLRKKKAATAVEWRRSFWGSDSGDDVNLAADEAGMPRLETIQEEIDRLFFQENAGISFKLDQATEAQSLLSVDDRANLREMRKLYEAERNENPEHNQALNEAKDVLRLSAENEDISSEDLQAAIAGVYDALREKFRAQLLKNGHAPKNGGSKSLSESFSDAHNLKLERDAIPQAIVHQFSTVKISDIEGTLTALKKNLPGILRLASDSDRPAPLPEVSDAQQKAVFQELADQIMQSAGWTSEKQAAQGVHLTMHAKQGGIGFTMGSHKDQHVAFEITPDNIVAGILNVGHEMGHVLRYLSPNDLPASIKDQPVGQPYDFIIHEYSAMFLEQSLRSREFWELAAPALREKLNVQGKAWSADNLYKTANFADPEKLDWNSTLGNLAYNAAMTAVDLALLRQDIDPKQAPEFWARQMNEMTGGHYYDAQDYPLVDSLGYLQDGWAMYTHTYEAGLVGAIALMDEYDRRSQGCRPAGTIEEFLTARVKFLQDNVFKEGSRYEPDALLQNITGSQPTTGALLQRLLASAHCMTNSPSLSGL